VALGSTRGRLARQLLTEALLVSLLVGMAGLGFAELLLRALNRLPQAAESHLAANVDARVFGVGLVLTLVSALLFGMLPARQAWQSSPMRALKSGAEQVHLRRFAMRDVLLGAQIAICTLLVTASFVAVRGMQRMLNAPLGFQPKNAMLVDMDLGDWSQTGNALVAEQKSLIRAVRSTPGVTAVGTVNKTPMRGGMHGARIFQPGTTDFKASNSVLAPYLFSISPGYLQAAQTRLLSGRDVSWDDTATTPYVALVNETFARKMWGSTPAIGQHFIVSGKLTQVVGVVEDGKYHDLEESPYPVAYLPVAQNEDDETIFIVRSPRSASEMTAALRHTLGAAAPNVTMGMQSWSDVKEGELLPARAATVALSAMGSMAAMLAVTGIFGMAAYSVSRRMKELGIRVALGAGRARLMQSAVGRPLGLLLGGIAVGLALAVLAKPLMGRIVYQAEPRDPLVLGGVLATMVLIGVAASWIPARRALQVDPSRLMRED
jgi:predicted permease